MSQTKEQVEFAIGALRKGFLELMDLIIKLPGAPIQKQQALLRFDEGHMWMQNAVVSYVPPAAPPAVPVPPVDQAAQSAEPVQEPAEAQPQTDAA